MTEARSAYHSRVLLLLRLLQAYCVKRELWGTAYDIETRRLDAREAWAGEVFPRAGLQRAR